MKAQSPYPLLLLVSSVFAAPAVFAADASPPAGSARAPALENTSPVTASASMHVLRERMQEMRRTSDPDRRMQLMEAQMRQLDDVIRSLGGVCPTPDVAPATMGMTNGDRTGAANGEETMARRMDMMEKRMDMMQMMLQRQNASANDPGAGR